MRVLRRARSLNKDVTTRIRTEESVIMEIKEILSTYPDIQSIRILDDLFLRNGKSIDMANNIFFKISTVELARNGSCVVSNWKY